MEPDDERPLTIAELHALLAAVGFLGACDATTFDAACRVAQRAEEHAADDVALVDVSLTEVAIAALAVIYGPDGPTAVSLADRCFVVDEPARRDSVVLGRVARAFESWLGRPLPAPLTERADVDEMACYVGDSLFFARPAGGTSEIASFEGSLGDEPFRVYALRTSRDGLEALPVPIRRHLSPDLEAVRVSSLPPEPPLTLFH